VKPFDILDHTSLFNKVFIQVWLGPKNVCA